MNRTFEYWDQQFLNNNQFAFNNEISGLIWLKVERLIVKNN